MSETLGARELNRATLSRQHLLARVAVPALDAIEHLGGMQSQAPLAPYVGLWTRLEAFDPSELSQLTESRQVVRLNMMRNTMHLVSARDCLAWRGLFSQRHRADFRAHFSKSFEQVDLEALLDVAVPVLGAGPVTRAKLGMILAEHWPGVDPRALAYAATHHLALCQVPPRGVWGSVNGTAEWVSVETWLGRPLRSEPVDELVQRYLGAFGPATVADTQQWSGLTRLREVVERLPLRKFLGEDGQDIYDLADAARPPGDTPAPPRFLPAYDNVLLSHKDRSRVISGKRRVPLPAGNGTSEGTFLIDGMWHGTWKIVGRAMHVLPFAPLSLEDRDALTSEAERLLSFLGRDDGWELIVQ